MKKRNPISLLTIYDAVLFVVIAYLILHLHPSQNEIIPTAMLWLEIILGLLLIITSRVLFGIYRQIWRYGSMQAYLRLILADGIAGLIYMLIIKVLPNTNTRVMLIVSLVSINLTATIVMRMAYYVFYQLSSQTGKTGNFSRKVLKLVGNVDTSQDENRSSIDDERKIRVAIVGAGRLGLALEEDFNSNPESIYKPVCFIDNDASKTGKSLGGLPILNETEATPDLISKFNVQEIIFALPRLSSEEKARLYSYYRTTGCRIQVYDYPATRSAKAGKLQLRDFDIEELLPRRVIMMESPETNAFYYGKKVLVTGGGGSIGSELCRQIAAMKPETLIVLDFAENTTYDLQQELLAAYGKNSESPLNLEVEICSVTDKSGLEKVFRVYRPQIVLHAAAHKHVPLMEHNCCEAIKNNVFGTKNVIDLCLKYEVENFTLISSDKAVNPTNAMGSTKRMCEMIMQCASNSESKTTKFCAVRFGNVMGSAGSVIPLFKKQIASGGPVTITDKKIIRYFMTIAEASHLVLEAGAKAGNGELFVLDMGQPVSILELAENMIRLSGFKPYEDIDIIETGLRPGEKLYEELLMKSETLSKTDNELIFIEKDEPISADRLSKALDTLKNAVSTEDDILAKAALKEVVPTYKDPEYYNKQWH